MNYSADIKKAERRFLPANFKITDWASIEPYYQSLWEKPINSIDELIQWLSNLSELEAAISEDGCWRQIKMTCDTENQELEDSFNDFCLNILPPIQNFTDKLNRKLMECPYINQLDPSFYGTYLRNIRNNIELFREENIPIQAEMSVLQQQYGQITGAMSIVHDGKEYTMQQAGKFLQHPDRSVRATVYQKIQERRYQDKEQLNELFDKLMNLRTQQAKNAGFENYTDFRFKELGRFDYTPQECFSFHEAVKQHVLPLVKSIYINKQKTLGLDQLKPWDIDAEPKGVQPLAPFKNGTDLLQKSIACFKELNPFFGACLEKMKELNHLDLDSRKGKAPGGYNCPLAESGAPFIFMNAAGQMHDVTTMVHEGGHAIHSFLAHPLPLTGLKEYPMEIAEVASMSMELFSMDYWHHFFDNKEDLKRAKLHQLERVITIFPWIAIIDKFQHWLYKHPQHTHAERATAWTSILNEFDEGVVNYSGLEEFRKYSWQRQLHLYEVPFYYIEYGIAQLGAIGMWMQFKNNKEQALENYCNALKAGATKTLPELYSIAGISFDFAPNRIKTLMDFVKAEMEAL